MPNLLSYLSVYKNAPLAEYPFGEADALVFAAAAYIPFGGIVGESFSFNAPLGEAFEKASRIASISRNARSLCIALSESSRYSGCLLGAYLERVSDEAIEQFAAVSALLPDGRVIAAFRGTEPTLRGWQEDFNMGFMHEIPSQAQAVKYLGSLAEIAPGSIIPLGHSKGGNLAVYAASFCSSEAKGRLSAIYSFDGPGFLDETINDPNYIAISKKILTYIPQSSVIGLLLGHKEYFIIVKSDSGALFAHDVFTWQITGSQISRLSQVNESSAFLNMALKRWISEMGYQQRQQMVGTLFGLLEKASVHTAADFAGGWPFNMLPLYSAEKGIDPKVLHLATEILHMLRKNST
ncbi:MAG: DUF2974 domain-containing protein [Eubacteriaceae bacterium]|nr:DUF2974 domain-containing protein [Eubacteriaceae bacterium]